MPKRPNEPTFRQDLYRGTAVDYDQYRLRYPRALADELRLALSLDGRGQLVDLACGTGQVARLLSQYFGHVLGVDQEPAMIEVARARSARERDGIAWAVARAETLELPASSVDLVTIGNAFHRLDRPIVARRVLGWLKPDGALALFWSDAPWSPGRDWQAALGRTISKWTQRTGAATRIPEGWRREDYPDDHVLRDVGFSRFSEYTVAESQTWTIEAIFGFLRSTSFASRDALGAEAEAFEADVRRVLTSLNPQGTYEQIVTFVARLARP